MAAQMKRCALRLFLFCFILAHAPSAQATEIRLANNLPSGCRVEIIFASNPLTTMTEIPFSITLTEPGGTPLSDAMMTVALDMASMPMPPNHPPAEWRGDAYRGTAIFTMAGEWQIRVEIQRPGKDPESAVFKVAEVRM